MRKFDTKVQDLKYQVLREVASSAFEDNLLTTIHDIPKTIIPGKESTMRCCVYKERAILSERVKLAVGGNKLHKNVIEVIDIACDECPVGGYFVTDICRGCIAHHCQEACRRKAITFDESLKAHINKDLCVECGLCAKVCPYDAISNRQRPCERACKVNAIKMDEHTKAAVIEDDKCIACGACAFLCPFGAITDKSYILNAVDLIQRCHNNKHFHLYAIVAPAIASQFRYAELGQLITGIRMLGFYKVMEVALGADIVAMEESKELEEKGFLTSSCCPAFVDYIHKHFPSMVEHISHNPSPMVAIAKQIKDSDPDAKVIFIGPCTAKKMEARKKEVRPYVDCVLTFEELQALLDSRNIDLPSLAISKLDEASGFGRNFAHSGGVSAAVKQALQERGSTFEVKPEICDGIDACRLALTRASKGRARGNFIEGMACTGGCVNGAGCLSHSDRNVDMIIKHGDIASAETIRMALQQFDE
ncbi:MAG: 4Fe-4S dicluster domain-containing protein [Oscillospiraceae bacterium]|jgi:[FeFe] hydrogenase (group B1/B3)